MFFFKFLWDQSGWKSTTVKQNNQISNVGTSEVKPCVAWYASLANKFLYGSLSLFSFKKAMLFSTSDLICKYNSWAFSRSLSSCFLPSEHIKSSWFYSVHSCMKCVPKLQKHCQVYACMLFKNIVSDHGLSTIIAQMCVCGLDNMYCAFQITSGKRHCPMPILELNILKDATWSTNKSSKTIGNVQFIFIQQTESKRERERD